MSNLFPLARPALALLALGSLLVALSGCGGSNVKDVVSGKVSLDGKPVAGTVAFIGGDSKEVSAPLIGGKYSIINPPRGDVKITVKPPLGGVPPVSKPARAEDPVPVQEVAPPAKYTSPDNGLTFKVTGGTQTNDIELKP